PGGRSTRAGRASRSASSAGRAAGLTPLALVPARAAGVAEWLAALVRVIGFLAVVVACACRGAAAGVSVRRVRTAGVASARADLGLPEAGFLPASRLPTSLPTASAMRLIAPGRAAGFFAAAVFAAAVLRAGAFATAPGLRAGAAFFAGARVAATFFAAGLRAATFFTAALVAAVLRAACFAAG